VTGGRISRLAMLRFRWAPAIVLGLVVQLGLFSSPLGDALGPAAPWVYLGSTVLVLVAVARNVAIPGLALVVVGGACNALAILANGGYMPVGSAALAAMGRPEAVGYSNSRLVEDVRLWPLTDVFAMPTWMPAANVFSVGDVLIGVGVAAAIVLAMHERGETGAPVVAADATVEPGERARPSAAPVR
jgi:uncharacterized protein DUF5317